MAAREFIVGTRQQQEWGWLLIVDLFLAGTGSALFFTALILGFLPGMAAGGGLVIAGALVLLGDLSHPQSAWRLLSRAQSSWMSRGTIGILSFTVLAFAHIAYLATQPNGWASLGAPWVAGPAWAVVLAVMSGIAALFVASYPGFLFGGMRPLPLWNGAHVPALFLVSALLGSLGVVYLLPSSWMSQPWSLVFLQNFGLGLVVLELFLLSGLVLLARTEATRESVHLLTHGSLRFHFYIGVLGLGLIVPLAILGFVYAGAAAAPLLPIAGVLLLLGTLLLRYVIVRAGVYTSVV